MNARGVPNTCKSNEVLCSNTKYPSGERVSNALVTYPKVWDNSPKGLLIPHTSAAPTGAVGKDGLSLEAITGR